MHDLPEIPDPLTVRLDARLDDLERRVSLLEQRAAPLPASAGQPIAAPPAPPLPEFAFSSGALTILGRAMLGIAGAYLLRALEESGSLPRLAVASAALLYAMLWLAVAARVRDQGWPASTTYACTSALILAPMLWELTLRFNLLPAAATAAVLAGFALLASLLAARRPAVVAVAHIAVAVVALALAVAAHSLPPFLATLLFLTALGEYAVLRSSPVRARLLVAIATDIGVWALIYIYMGAPSTRAEYPPLGVAALLAPGLVLFTLAGSGTVVRTLAQHRPITIFDIFQTTLAFLLAASALLAFGPSSAALVFGCSCMLLASAGYAVVLLRVSAPAGPRTEGVFAAWSAALLLAGGWFCLPPQSLAALLCILALAAVLLARRRSQPPLDLHIMLFLAAAAVASGLPAYAFLALAATPSGLAPWSIFLVTVAALCCYLAARPQSGLNRTRLALRVISALFALAALSALAAGGLAGLLALRLLPQPHHLAFIRTLTLCVAALLLAYCGARWRRFELTRLGYVVLILVAAKLLLDDLRHGHLEFVAASIFLFALTLIAVPRMARTAPCP